MSTLTRDELLAALALAFPDNNLGLISPDDLRQQQIDMIDSCTSTVTVSVNSNYAAQAVDDIIICNGNLNITLFPVGTAVKRLTIQNISDGIITIEPFGANTIDGLDVFFIGPNLSLSITPTLLGDWQSIGEPVDRGYFFLSKQRRDEYFNNEQNARKLQIDMPIITGDDNGGIVNYNWQGANNPTGYNPELWRIGSLATGSNSLYLGGMRLSSGAALLNITTAGGQKTAPVTTNYDDTGTKPSIRWEFGPLTQFPIANVFDTQLSIPQSLSFVQVGDALAVTYSIRPATTGTLRVQTWLGTDDTGSSIMDQYTIIDGSDVGTVKEIIHANDQLILDGDEVYIRYSGVELFGGLQISGIAVGQITPFSISGAQVATQIPLGNVNGPISGATSGLIATYDDVTGTQLRAQSDITATARALKTFTPNSDLVLLPNGTGTIEIGSILDNEGIRCTALSTKIDDYEITQGEIIKESGDFRFTLTDITAEFEFTAPAETNIDIDAQANTYSGISFSKQGVPQGGTGQRLNQLVLQPNNWYEDVSYRGIVIDLTDTQTRVEGIKHYIDNGFPAGPANVIQAEPDRHLFLNSAGTNARIYISPTAYTRTNGQVNLLPTTDPTIAALRLNGVTTTQFATMSEAQRDTTVTGGADDYGKTIFNVDALDLEYYDGSGWVGLKQNGNHRSFDLIIGSDNGGVSYPSPQNLNKQQLTGEPIHKYKIDGLNGNPADYNQGTGLFTMPADAPTGLYQINMRGRVTLQGFDRSTVSDTSQWLFHISVNNASAGFSGDPDTPVHNAFVWDDSFSDTTVKHLKPTDTIALQYNILYNNSNVANWILNEVRYQLVYLGRE